MHSDLVHQVIVSVVFSLLGLVLFGLSFLFIRAIVPFSLRKEIEEDQNTALGILIGSVIIGLSLIIAAAIRGLGVAIAEGQCPSCGAPIAFAVGSSIAAVCKFCKHVVVRSDRSLDTLGKVADVTNLPSLLAIGDDGVFDGKRLRVLGRVQLDHGAGPWDEWYVGVDDGWAWLAYAQGNWYATFETPAPGALPPWEAIRLEEDVRLGDAGTFRVAERKEATIVAAEGELPEAIPPGKKRRYADLHGRDRGFATIDWGDGEREPVVFVGRWFDESALVVRRKAERPKTEIATEAITCPNCGAGIPALAPDRAERLACRFCGAISDIATERVLEVQTRARAEPRIPLGSRGTLRMASWVVCGFVERSASFEGERFTWEEYLLFSEGTGFRWLVKDESTWLFVTPLSIAEIDLARMPDVAVWGDRPFRLRNESRARVDYVVGEFYWKVRVGETVLASDYVSGGDVLSREAAEDEVAWTYSEPVAWSDIASAFSLAASTPAGLDEAAETPTTKSNALGIILFLLVALIFLAILCGSCDGCDGGGGFVPFGSSRGGK